MASTGSTSPGKPPAPGTMLGAGDGPPLAGGRLLALAPGDPLGWPPGADDVGPGVAPDGRGVGVVPGAGVGPDGGDGVGWPEPPGAGVGSPGVVGSALGIGGGLPPPNQSWATWRTADNLSS